MRAYSSLTAHDSLSFHPDAVFQLVPGAYNRLQVRVHPKRVGLRSIGISFLSLPLRRT